MKKIKSLLIATLCLGALVVNCPAQTNTSNEVLKQHLLAFAQDAKAARSVTVAVYPTYAPQIEVNGVKHQWGAGVALLCPASVIPALDGTTIGNHAYGGLRFDQLGGEFFASTVALGVKADFQILGHNFTAFGESGANIPITGAGKHNIELGAMVGSGIHTSVFQFGKPNADGVKPGSLNVFAAVEKWTQFAGLEFHPGAAITWGW